MLLLNHFSLAFLAGLQGTLMFCNCRYTSTALFYHSLLALGYFWHFSVPCKPVVTLLDVRCIFQWEIRGMLCTLQSTRNCVWELWISDLDQCGWSKMLDAGVLPSNHISTAYRIRIWSHGILNLEREHW